MLDSAHKILHTENDHFVPYMQERDKGTGKLIHLREKSMLDSGSVIARTKSI